MVSEIEAKRCWAVLQVQGSVSQKQVSNNVLSLSQHKPRTRPQSEIMGLTAHRAVLCLL